MGNVRFVATTDGNGAGNTEPTDPDRRPPMLVGAGAGLAVGLVPAAFFPPIAVLTVPVGVVGGLLAGARWADR